MMPPSGMDAQQMIAHSHLGKNLALGRRAMSTRQNATNASPRAINGTNAASGGRVCIGVDLPRSVKAWFTDAAKLARCSSAVKLFFTPVGGDQARRRYTLAPIRVPRSAP